MKIWIVFLLVISGSQLKAKVRNIYIKQELLEASSIKNVIVLGYQDSVMFYVDMHSADTQKISCRIRSYSERDRDMLISAKGMRPTDLAGKWPLKGEHVLMVIGKTNRVVLFATIEGIHYRFWDPNSIAFANSVFYIPKENNFKPLLTCQQRNIHQATYWFCSDGCLVDARWINTLLFKS